MEKPSRLEMLGLCAATALALGSAVKGFHTILTKMVDGEDVQVNQDEIDEGESLEDNQILAYQRNFGDDLEQVMGEEY